MNLFYTITLVLLILKLVGLLHCGWFIVFLPALVPWMFVLILAVLIGVAETITK
jgi:hypothetical protein